MKSLNRLCGILTQSLMNYDMVSRNPDGTAWYKQNPGDKIWWLYGGKDRPFNDDIVFSFDKIQKYYLWDDYPDKLTQEEKELFDREHPFWADNNYGY